MADSNLVVQTQRILQAAAEHDIQSLNSLLRQASANVQDPQTGTTPLHAAVAACEPNETKRSHGTGEENLKEKAAVRTVKLLLQNGAIWNDLDERNETPGCVALRHGLKEVYEVMIEAGVRAEMLLQRLQEFEQQVDDEERSETDSESGENANETSSQEAPESNPGHHTRDDDTVKSLDNTSYLRAPLRFHPNHIADSENNAVMMDWEAKLMKRHAELLCPQEGLRILNIGFGQGIIDTSFQTRKPQSHHIIEAHPEILQRMKEEGWDAKPGVTVLEGRWQEVVPTILEKGTLFDAIYFDTFAEDYSAFRDFFSDQLVGLLVDGGRFSFFNGLGADRQICYDVYTRVVEMELFESGFDTAWEVLKVHDLENRWKGIRRPYWVLAEYKLPICTSIA